MDYSVLDQPSILRYIFYPRKDYNLCPENAFDIAVPVDPGVSLSCRFYVGDHGWPWILFFHGNGEVVSDYDGIAPFYHQRELNLVVTDYRGYGTSTGNPTLTDLVKDSWITLTEVRKTLSARTFRNDLWIMGRSLGSIAALELAYRDQETLRGLIIESGGLSIVRVMRHLRIPAYGIDLEGIDREFLDMVKKISIPVLIFHGEQDELIPLQEANDLYRHLGSDEKQLIVIPSAGHNDIMVVGFQKYFEALQRFVSGG